MRCPEVTHPESPLSFAAIKTSPLVTLPGHQKEVQPPSFTLAQCFWHLQTERDTESFTLPQPYLKNLGSAPGKPKSLPTSWGGGRGVTSSHASHWAHMRPHSSLLAFWLSTKKKVAEIPPVPAIFHPSINSRKEVLKVLSDNFPSHHPQCWQQKVKIESGERQNEQITVSC